MGGRRSALGGSRLALTLALSVLNAEGRTGPVDDVAPQTPNRIVLAVRQRTEWRRALDSKRTMLVLGLPGGDPAGVVEELHP